MNYIKIAIPLFIGSLFAAPLLGPLFTVVIAAAVILWLLIYFITKIIIAVFRLLSK